MPSTVSYSEYRNAAKTLGVTVAAIQAVFEVESSRSGFASDGRVKVNYEPHVMRQRLTSRYGRDRAVKAMTD